MPLLEINQTRYISASVRLDESTAEQVDQYAAFVHASADDVVDKALNYVFAKDRDFQDFLKTPQADRKSWMRPPPSRSISTPLSSTHPQMMLWTRRSTMSSRRTVISRTF